MFWKKNKIKESVSCFINFNLFDYKNNYYNYLISGDESLMSEDESLMSGDESLISEDDEYDSLYFYTKGASLIDDCESWEKESVEVLELEKDDSSSLSEGTFFVNNDYLFSKEKYNFMLERNSYKFFYTNEKYQQLKKFSLLLKEFKIKFKLKKKLNFNFKNYKLNSYEIFFYNKIIKKIYYKENDIDNKTKLITILLNKKKLLKKKIKKWVILNKKKVRMKKDINFLLKFLFNLNLFIDAFLEKKILLKNEFNFKNEKNKIYNFLIYLYYFLKNYKKIYKKEGRLLFLKFFNFKKLFFFFKNENTSFKNPTFFLFLIELKEFYKNIEKFLSYNKKVIYIHNFKYLYYLNMFKHFYYFKINAYKYFLNFLFKEFIFCEIKNFYKILNNFINFIKIFYKEHNSYISYYEYNYMYQSCVYYDKEETFGEKFIDLNESIKQYSNQFILEKELKNYDYYEKKFEWDIKKLNLLIEKFLNENKKLFNLKILKKNEKIVNNLIEDYKIILKKYKKYV